MGRYMRGDPVDVWVSLATVAGTTYGTRWDTVSLRRVNNCGDWHTIGVGGARHNSFFPYSVHRSRWFRDTLVRTAATGGPAIAFSVAQRDAHTGVGAGALKAGALMRNSDAKSEGLPRCYLGGDPHLVAIERYKVGADSLAAFNRASFAGVRSLSQSANRVT